MVNNPQDQPYSSNSPCISKKKEGIVYRDLLLGKKIAQCFKWLPDRTDWYKKEARHASFGDHPREDGFAEVHLFRLIFI